MSELVPDVCNTNKHTSRGLAMLETSVRRYGTGRSVLCDKNGKLIAGHATTEMAVGVGISEDIILVPSDGTKLVVVQRTDLDLDTDIAAKELGIADNRTAEVGLVWDTDLLEALETKEGVKLGQFFSQAEFERMLKQPEEGEPEYEIPEMALQPFEEYNYVMVVTRNSQDWQGLCDKLGIRKEVVTLGKTRKIGIGRVLDGAKLLEALGCASSSRPDTAPTSSTPTPSVSSPTPPSASAPARRRHTGS